MHNKTYRFLSLALSLAVFLAACGRSPGPGRDQSLEPTSTPPQLNIGEQGDILFLTPPDIMDPEIYPDFQGESELEISEIHYQDDQEAVNLIRSFGNQESYGLIMVDEISAQTLINEGYLAQLNRNNIPNLDGLTDRFNNLPFDTGNRFCAPVLWSTTGITYDASQTTPPTSWGALLTADVSSPFYGRISFQDDPREALGAALLYLGYDVNSTDERQIREAADLLKESAASRIGFVSSDLPERLATREVALAQGNSSQLSPALESNENLAFSLPQEGGFLHVRELCIPRTASETKKAAAESFINFLLAPETSAVLAGNNFSGSPVEVARNLLSLQSFGENFRYPNDADLVPLLLIKPLGESDEFYADTFADVKSSQ